MLPPVLITSLAASLALAERSFVLDAPAEVVATVLPAETRSDQLALLRFRAFTRIAGKHEPRLPPASGRARLRAVNAVFLPCRTRRPEPPRHQGP